MERNVFLQGVFPFQGRGFYDSESLDHSLNYTVPVGRRAKVVYVRVGNHAEDLIYLTLTAGGNPLRYFPVGPRDAMHIPLAIQEDQPAGTTLEFQLAAERGVVGTVILDCGIVEEPAP